MTGDRPQGQERIVTSGALREWALPVNEGDKEARGRLLVVGGSVANPGGALLAAEAAMRSGAGKLQIATVDAVAPGMALAIPEAAVWGLPQDEDGDISPEAGPRIVELAEDCSVVLLGPGIGDPKAAGALLAEVVPHLTSAVVIDALGMAYLTEHRDGVAHLEGRAVLSPNIGELARTLDVDKDAAREDPPSHIVRLARESGAVVVSGTSTTWACDPAGAMWRDDSGVPGLGTSGSGDVKAGVIAGILTAGADPLQAAVWATFAHGRAGERLASHVGSVGFLARELLTEVPRVLAELEVG